MILNLSLFSNPDYNHFLCLLL